MTRVPTETDFAGLAPDLTVALHYPEPPASTTAILLLFHGLGDAERPFADFARAMNLPGVLAVAVRGTSVVPPSLVSGGGGGDADLDLGRGPQHFHWGDDLALRGGPDGDDLDDDPGFDQAVRAVDGRLIRDVLVGRCGWRRSDMLLFGFGQGGTFALALAARTAAGATATGTTTTTKNNSNAPALPAAVTMGMTSAAPRLATPLLVCGAAGGDAVSAETAALLRERFASVQLVRWRRARDDDNGMPRNRDEFLPIMQFLAARLSTW
ncbi:short chain dehydrogenase reductase [Niveomyces insectorum RCEF 264]|uniref:Short chain dehydrogenase reductase n=1 Tax=Niveomyces insectorum RCEF 264 TaxID=1081102 RepID=A0A167X490_9HYPO|nr:short chain dehydrogenase reductase [Niveomyces insectorum RCEF 264]